VNEAPQSTSNSKQRIFFTFTIHARSNKNYTPSYFFRLIDLIFAFTPSFHSYIETTYHFLLTVQYLLPFTTSNINNNLTRHDDKKASTTHRITSMACTYVCIYVRTMYEHNMYVLIAFGDTTIQRSECT
jgi:hypothetical protein